MKRLFHILIVVAAAFSCNQKADKPNAAGTAANRQTWDSTDRYDFLHNCVEGQKQKGVNDTLAYAYCNCMLTQLEQQYAAPDSIPQLDSATIRQMEMNCAK